MRSICLVLVALFCGCLASTHFEGRIVGGSDADIGEIPYMVSVRGQKRHGCGGAILSERFVISAAHCFYGWDHKPEYFFIQYGLVDITSTENIIPVKKITLHPDYVHSGIYPNDIAIVEVNGTFVFSANARPVELPTPFEDPGQVNALLTGWGLDMSGGKLQRILKKVVIQIFSNSYCRSRASGFNPDLQFCAGVLGGGKGQCTGDSGGPIAIDSKIYGIVSSSRKPCAADGNPGYFTRVTTYRNWIWSITGL